MSLVGMAHLDTYGCLRHSSCYHPPPSATAYNTYNDLDQPHLIFSLHSSLSLSHKSQKCSNWYFLALECPETWKEFEGFCYKVMDRLGYRRRFAWSTALSGCFGFGGDLVSISNEKEMKFVHDMAFKDANRTSVWIGLAYRHQKGGYVWNNGESFNISVSVQWLNMSRIVYENKCVEILKTGENLTECCKENKHLICKRPKGELFLCGNSTLKMMGKFQSYQVRPKQM